jgi:hypothetical protein
MMYVILPASITLSLSLYSSLVSGAAVFAGGPFYCANSNAVTAQRQCMAVEGAGPDVAELAAFTRRKAALGQVDPLEHLRGAAVFLFSGAGDTVVDPQVLLLPHMPPPAPCPMPPAAWCPD